MRLEIPYPKTGGHRGNFIISSFAPGHHPVEQRLDDRSSSGLPDV
ncbi:MAG: hypothetical protein WKG52_05465 [Variovorax sp.]